MLLLALALEPCSSRGHYSIRKVNLTGGPIPARPLGDNNYNNDHFCSANS